MNPDQLIQAFGLMGIIITLFAESGTFLGFILPGDSLLFIAGILASQGDLPLLPLLIFGSIAAILGDQAGYWFGRKVGPALFRQEESFLFHKDRLEQARIFYDKYGILTIILARFVAYARTFAPMLAGVGKMNYRTFTLFNIIGGILWVCSITLVGYWLGHLFPDIGDYVFELIVVVIAFSILPAIVEAIRRTIKGRR
ncbi:MAG: VTT domain-containing protein [Candidatus Spechtbacteria bacterium]|nr:VTT domain-containing protein [Candidatus Spechtbacteria bacterium]